MKYINNPISKNFVKSKFIEKNIPFNLESLNYYSNKKMLLIKNDLVTQFMSASNYLGDFISKMIENFKNGDYLEFYNFNLDIKDKIINSLNNEELAFRCDWGIENGVPKLYEINAESCGFLLECGVIPEWVEECCTYKSVKTNLMKNYINKLEKNINTQEIVYLMSLDYIYDIQNLCYIKNLLTIKSERILISDIKRVDDYLFIDDKKINALHKIYPWFWLLEDSEIDCFNTISFSEPLWTLLFDSKIILYLLYKEFKNKHLLETFIFNQKKGQFIEKELTGMQGSKNIKSMGIKKYKESILQRKIEPIKIDDDILNFSTWLINKKFSGLGVKTSSKIISDHNHKFVPLAIE